MKAAKNKQNLSFADLVADSELETLSVSIGDHSVTIRELTGRERFSLTEKADDPRWDTMLWVAFTGLVDPKPETELELEKLKVDWVVQIANAVLKISGLADDAAESAENALASVSDTGIS